MSGAEGMAGMTASGVAAISSEVVAISVASAGMITMYGVPVVGGTDGMGTDWDGGGSWQEHGIYILNRFIHTQILIHRRS